MDNTQDAEARRAADLLKAFASVAVAVLLVSALFNFVKSLHFDFSFGGFIDAAWSLIRDLFLTGVSYAALLGASQIILLLLEIKANTKKPT